MGPDELHVEMNPTGSAWVDITSDVRSDSGIVITHGTPGEGQSASASTANLTLKNLNNQYSPGNPNSSYYPYLNRNTPIRIWTESSTQSLYIPYNNHLNYASTPDSASLDITGDIDIRGEISLADIGRTVVIAGKWGGVSAQRSWRFGKASNGLFLIWVDSSDVTHTEYSTIRGMRFRTGHRHAFRVTLDVNNESSGHTLTFYEADTIDGPWVQLGDTVVKSGTTDIRSTTSSLTVGSDGNSEYTNYTNVHSVIVMNGIEGTEVANPDFTIQTVGATSFDDVAGNTWTLVGDSEISKRSDRFHGELGTLRGFADISGRDKQVPVVASGPLRRIQQGTSSTQSTLRRAIPNVPGLVAYWPCEEGSNATSISSAISSASGMVIAGTPSFAGYSNFKASNPIPSVGTSRWTGLVPSYTSTGIVQVRFIINFPASGLVNNDVICSIYPGGTLYRADLIWTTSGGLKLTSYDNTGASLGTVGPGAFGAEDVDFRVSVEFKQNGSDVDVGVWAISPGVSNGGISDTLSSCTVGACKRVTINPNQNADGISVGHISVQSAVDTLDALYDELNAWSGESALDRFTRLCTEENINNRREAQSSVSTQAMGYQGIDSIINLLRECENTDGGMLLDDRHAIGLLYKSKGSLFKNGADIEFDLSANVLSRQPEPIYDDQLIRNDIEVSRTSGSSVRIADTTSRLSISDPPNGVGVYKDFINVNPETDDYLLNIGGWLLHLGTYEGARFSSITVNRSSNQISSNSSLDDQILSLEIGDTIYLTNPQDWISDRTVQLLIVGMTEYLSNFEHIIEFNCQPAEPWTVGVYNDELSIYDTDGSELATPIESYTATFAGTGTRSYDGTNITGDIDIRVKASLNDWTPSARQTLAAKYLPTGNQRSWRFQVISATEGTPGCLRLYWSNNGSTVLLATSTAATGISDGAVKWCRVTLDVNNGAAGCDTKFYLSDDGVNWAQLGSTVTQPFTTSIFESTALYQIGADDGAALGRPLSGVVYGVQVISGLVGGTSLVPYHVEDWTDGYSGSATGGSTLAAVSSTAYMAISNTESTYWTTDAGQYPIDLKMNGEIIRVAGCTGTGASQTFTTCTRGINGAVKSHESGDDFSLANPVYYG